MSSVASSGETAVGIIVLIVFVAFYVYFSYSQYLMAKKTGVSDPWMAWFPILNLYILIKTAGKPGWWFFLFLIPLLNIVMSFVVWYNTALRLNKSGGLGILVAIFPFLIGILAFSEMSVPTISAPPTSTSA
jgi:hypothetical protein